MYAPRRAAAPRTARTAPPSRASATTVAARRAAARPPQRDTFPLAVSAVVIVLLVGILAVLVLNRSDTSGTATIAPPAIIPTTVPNAAGATAATDEQAAVPRINLADFKALYDNPAKRPLIIDVRAKDNYDQGHIDGAISFPEADLDTRFKELPKDKLVVAYCQ